MVSYNQVILTGKVAKVALCHYRPDGSRVVQFCLELSHPETPFGGCQTSQIDVVVIGELAESEPNLFQCGQHLLVEGRLQPRCWKTPEGRPVSRVEVIATHFRKVEP